MGFRELVGLTQDACERTFGEAITWRTSAGVDVTTTPAGELLLGVFRDQFTPVEVGMEVEISTVAPQLDVKLADLPEAPQRHGVVIVRGATYRIVEEQPDGEGMTKLLLHKVSA